MFYEALFTPAFLVANQLYEPDGSEKKVLEK